MARSGTILLDEAADCAAPCAPVLLLHGTGHATMALSTALDATGWVCLPPSRVTAHRRPDAAVLVCTGPGGAEPAAAGLVRAGAPVVAVGPLRRPAALIAAVRAGATCAVDLDLPFPALVDAVLEGLSSRLRPDRVGVLAALLRRQCEADLLDRLTGREREILRDLADGLTAGNIARARTLAIATVRSHIRAIMRKLGVSSQLAAAALGHRVLPVARSTDPLEDGRGG